MKPRTLRRAAALAMLLALAPGEARATGTVVKSPLAVTASLWREDAGPGAVALVVAYRTDADVHVDVAICTLAMNDEVLPACSAWSGEPDDAALVEDGGLVRLDATIPDVGLVTLRWSGTGSTPVASCNDAAAGFAYTLAGTTPPPPLVRNAIATGFVGPWQTNRTRCGAAGSQGVLQYQMPPPG